MVTVQTTLKFVDLEGVSREASVAYHRQDDWRKYDPDDIVQWTINTLDGVEVTEVLSFETEQLIGDALQAHLYEQAYCAAAEHAKDMNKYYFEPSKEDEDSGRH